LVPDKIIIFAAETKRFDAQKDGFLAEFSTKFVERTQQVQETHAAPRISQLHQICM